MNNKVFGVIAFAVGAAIGSAVTWKIVKTKYERIANEEIESVKEVFSKRQNREDDIETVEEVKEDAITRAIKPDIHEYASRLVDGGYTNYNNIKEDEESMHKPYTIPPEEYGEGDGYDMMSLTYYADGVLVDDWGHVYDKKLVGEDNLNTFGEYEADSVFVRNDEEKIEYEILLDLQKYEDVAHIEED